MLFYNLQFKELVLFFPREGSIPSTSFWVIKIILRAEIISWNQSSSIKYEDHFKG